MAPAPSPASEVAETSAASAYSTQSGGAALAAVEDLYNLLNEKNARVALLEDRLADLEAERGAHYRVGPVSSFMLTWLVLAGLASAGVFLARKPRARGVK